MKNTYIYRRVSTQRQAQLGASLDAQAEQCEAYFKYRLEPQGYLLAGTLTDAAHSGGKQFLLRPSGKQLGALVENGDAVIISRLDRGFRNLKDLLFTVDVWKARNISLHLLDLQVDTSTDIGRLMISVIGATAEFEKSVRNERVRQSKEVLAKQGYHVVGATPYGFRKIPSNGHVILGHDPEQRAFGKLCVELSEKGMTCYQIHLHCLQHRIRYRDRKPNDYDVLKCIRGERAIRWREAEHAIKRERELAQEKREAEEQARQAKPLPFRPAAGPHQAAGGSTIPAPSQPSSGTNALADEQVSAFACTKRLEDGNS